MNKMGTNTGILLLRIHFSYRLDFELFLTLFELMPSETIIEIRILSYSLLYFPHTTNALWVFGIMNYHEFYYDAKLRYIV